MPDPGKPTAPPPDRDKADAAPDSRGPDANNSSTVAVVDIGSNTIKILVAAREATEHVRTLFEATRETRLSHGLANSDGALCDKVMDDGVAAVSALLEQAAPYRPKAVRIVATSALREATNRNTFVRRIKDATGHEVRILSGEDEARAIARALRLDPALAGYRDYYVFDLGGGSLEGLVVRGGSVKTVKSFPLGAVRLTDEHLPNREKPFSNRDRQTIESEVAETLEESGFTLAMKGPLVATGGALMVAHAILASGTGIPMEKRGSRIHVNELESLLNEIGRLPLAERAGAVPGLPATRADIMPAALVTFLKLASLAGVDEIIVSRYNLRYGFIDG